VGKLLRREPVVLPDRDPLDFGKHGDAAAERGEARAHQQNHEVNEVARVAHASPPGPLSRNWRGEVVEGLSKSPSAPWPRWWVSPSTVIGGRSVALPSETFEDRGIGAARNSSTPSPPSSRIASSVGRCSTRTATRVSAASSAARTPRALFQSICSVVPSAS